MKLVEFRVRDFRSVNDSGVVPVAKDTALVGRNESGKTSLLLALSELKPPGRAPRAFTAVRDFPRDRPMGECSPELIAVETIWDVEDADRAKLKAVWPRAMSVKRVHVDRAYSGKRVVRFTEGLAAENWMATQAVAPLNALDQIIDKRIMELSPDDEAAAQARTAFTALGEQVKGLLAAGFENAASWAQVARPVVDALRTKADELDAKTIDLVDRLVQAAAGDADGHQRAITTVEEKILPVFVYLDDWAFIPGHHDIAGFLNRRAQGGVTADDRLFEKLLKVADLDAQQLQNALNGSHEDRTLLTNRASRVFTRTLREFWKDRRVNVDFRVDERHFDVVVSDEDNESLTQLDQRSRGFRWYFSFFVTFAADTKGGDKENAVLLLDEPGLFLHATAQGALLKYFRELRNQIIFTTHSPFMIDVRALENVRTVILERDAGTTVNERPAGDDNTLFPLQAALGYDLSQSLFIGPDNVVVEGVTDFWYLSAVAEHLRGLGRPSLDTAIVLTPAGGASKVPLMGALLAAQRLRVAVLLDSDGAGDESLRDLLTTKLIRDAGVVRIAHAWETSPPKESEIEDLLQPAVFHALIADAYATELAGTPLVVNESIPRIARRVDAACEARGIKFNKSRIANLFLRRLGSDPASVVDDATLDRFARLFGKLNEVVDRIRREDRPPFR